MRRLLILLALAALPASAAKADLVIDDYSLSPIPPGGILLVDGQHLQFNGGSTVLGNYREMMLNVIPSTQIGNGRVSITDQTLRLETGVGVKAKLEMRYDGGFYGFSTSSPIDPIGLKNELGSPVDASQGGVNKGIAFSAANDLAGQVNGTGGSVIFTVYSGAAGQNVSTATVVLNESPAADTFLNYFVPFVSFTTLAGTGADFSALTAIKVVIDSTNNTNQDIALTRFVFAAPAPSGLVLAGMAVVLAGAVAWRRRKAVNPVGAI